MAMLMPQRGMTSERTLIRVIVVDDHPVVRSGIVFELEQQPDIAVPGAGADGNDALRLARAHQPDVVILDLSMPGPRAVEVVRQLRALPVPPQVLILTAHSEPEHVVTLLRAGAIGYVLKDENTLAISAAVRAAYQGYIWISTAVTTTLVDSQIRDEAIKPWSHLNTREMEVLRLVVMGKTNQEIGDELGISEKTVQKRLGEIFVKLDVTSRVGAAVRAVREGIV